MSWWERKQCGVCNRGSFLLHERDLRLCPPFAIGQTPPTLDAGSPVAWKATSVSVPLGAEPGILPSFTIDPLTCIYPTFLSKCVCLPQDSRGEAGCSVKSSGCGGESPGLSDSASASCPWLGEGAASLVSGLPIWVPGWAPNSLPHLRLDHPGWRGSSCYLTLPSSTSSHVWMWELDHKESLSTEELMLLNCSVGEDSWESLGLQGDPTSPS